MRTCTWDSVYYDVTPSVPPTKKIPTTPLGLGLPGQKPPHNLSHTCDRRIHSWPVVHLVPQKTQEKELLPHPPSGYVSLSWWRGGGGETANTGDSSWTAHRHASLSHRVPWWPGPHATARRRGGPCQEAGAPDRSRTVYSTAWKKGLNQNQQLGKGLILCRIEERKILFSCVKVILSRLTRYRRYI